MCFGAINLTKGRKRKWRKRNAQQETIRTKNNYKDNITPVWKKEVANESRRRENSWALKQQSWIRLHIWIQYDFNGGVVCIWLAMIVMVGKGQS
jgi:hypothetical protein